MQKYTIIKDQIYDNFKKWLTNQGAILQGIDYPVKFEGMPTLSVVASEKIDQNQMILAIPNSLIITSERIKQTELKQIIQEHGYFFEADKDFETEYYIFILFLMSEKIKGIKSFWSPYLQVIEQPFNITNYTVKEIEQLEDPYLLKQAFEYFLFREDAYTKFFIILEQYPTIFPKGSYNKELFIWAYDVVYNRVFTYNLPFPVLIPFADCFNHGVNGTSPYLINTSFEVEGGNKSYICKSSQLNIQAITKATQAENNITGDNNKSKLNEKELQTKKNEKKHGDNQKEKPKSKPSSNKSNEHGKVGIKESSEKLKDQMLEISKYHKLQEDFLSKLAPDKLKESKASNSPQNFLGTQLTNKEIIVDQIRKMNLHILNLQDQQQHEPKQIWDQQFFSSSDEEDNDSENEEPDTFLNNKEFQQQQNYEIEQIAKKQGKTSQILNTSGQQQLSLRQKYENLLDQEWNWYKPKEKNTYFILQTIQPFEKGQEVFTFYGRRNNRYLMLYNGFSLAHNKYESVTFRMIDYDVLNMLKLSSDTVFVDYLSENEVINQEFTLANKVLSTSILSKEFRLKPNKICDEFLTYIRIQIIKHYKQFQNSKYLLMLPSDYELEMIVLQAALNYLMNLQKQLVKTDIEDDKKFLNSIDQNEKRDKSFQIAKYSAIYRFERKSIIEKQIQLINVAIKILQKVGSGSNFKAAYLQKQSLYEVDENDFISCRYNLKSYLKKLYMGLVLNLGLEIGQKKL